MDRFRLGWDFLRIPANLRRLQRVLGAGLRDPYFGPLLRSSGLESVRDIHTVAAAERLLDSLPVSSVAALRTARPGWAPRYPDVLEHPLRPGVWAAAPEPGPHHYAALAGPAEMLLEAARQPVRRPHAEFAVLLLHHPGERAAGEFARDLLWDSFQVPIYSVLTGFDGAVLAYECEAQAGYHTTRDAIFESVEGRICFTSLTDFRNPAIRVDAGMPGAVATARCQCGRAGGRLVPAQGGRPAVARREARGLRPERVLDQCGRS